MDEPSGVTTSVGARAADDLDEIAAPGGPQGSAVPIIEETLTVSKVEVDRGGVRVSKRVEMQEELVDELLRHQHVSVERRPVGRAVSGDEMPEPYYEGNTLVVPVIEEVIVTEKRLMIVEEVCITRTRGTHQETQQVTLRKERIEIERLGAEPSVIRSSERPSK